MDLVGPDLVWDQAAHDQLPNSEAKKFYDLLQAADEPLYRGCKKLTKLLAMSKFLNIKSEFNMSEACYDRIMSIVKDILPEDANWPNSFYKTKKHLSKLGLAYERIDAWINKCLL
ncbi:UNVERIFIED_CONTAM: hypothetical protein Slati_1401100 [Sesamum latifolium]|uniref:Uncharacterized protein n=1 Tax=Sesamum latifolium TaxID=2727402 RepID=A0AAW2X344_9LAMI